MRFTMRVYNHLEAWVKQLQRINTRPFESDMLSINTLGNTKQSADGNLHETSASSAIVRSTPPKLPGSGPAAPRCGE